MINKELYRRDGNNIYIKQPYLEELSFVEKLWGNINNMNNVGRVYNFPKEKWEMFYKKMVYPTDKKNFYCLIYNYENEAVGEVGFHGYNSLTKVARINVKIDYRYRRQGYAKEALNLLLEYYFWDFGGETIIDYVNDEASSNLLKDLGFEVVNKFKDKITYKIEKNNFYLYKKDKKKTVTIIAYDNMDLMDYALIEKLFNDANNYLEEKYFEINTLSFKENVIINKDIKINIDKQIKDLNSLKGICIIPGSPKGDLEIESKIFSRLIEKDYRSLDDIITFDKGKYIIEPILKEEIDLNKIEYEQRRKITTIYTYKEKVRTCINIIKKNLGEKVAESLLKEIL